MDEWLKCVIRAIEPWLSSKDIDRGALCFTQISEQLANTTVGIVCITQDNKNKPWILFESGALAKGLSSSRVCTFLIDLTQCDLQDPLAQFNHTLADREGLLKLVVTINRSLWDKALKESILQKVFDRNWPEFEKKFTEIIENTPAETVPEKREENDLLTDILTSVRNLETRQRIVEESVSQSPPSQTNVRIVDIRPISDRIVERRRLLRRAVERYILAQDGTQP